MNSSLKSIICISIHLYSSKDSNHNPIISKQQFYPAKAHAFKAVLTLTFFPFLSETLLEFVNHRVGSA